MQGTFMCIQQVAKPDSCAEDFTQYLWTKWQLNFVSHQDYIIFLRS